MDEILSWHGERSTAFLRSRPCRTTTYGVKGKTVALDVVFRPSIVDRQAGEVNGRVMSVSHADRHADLRKTHFNQYVVTSVRQTNQHAILEGSAFDVRQRGARTVSKTSE